MKLLLALAALLALLPVAVTAEAKPVPHKPAAHVAAKPVVVPRDWLKTIARTRAGAYVIGNPAAKVKLVEYLSLTCPHCAHFAAEGYVPLETNYIRTGKVSLEIRHAIRDPFDMTASLLARCGPSSAYLSAIKLSFATQEAWAGKASDYAQANADALEKLTPEAQFAALGSHSGLDQAYAARGIPVARQAACLANSAEIQVLTGMANEAWAVRKIPGTPAFYINGIVAEDKLSWADLEPMIKAALR